MFATSGPEVELGTNSTRAWRGRDPKWDTGANILLREVVAAACLLADDVGLTPFMIKGREEHSKDDP
jgi:hypothetical protein